MTTTTAEFVYVDTLNLLGSDFEPDFIQVLLDAEHQTADPNYEPPVRHMSR